MITITKQNDGVLFTFQDSDKYLYGNGTIEVPFNSLSIIADESDMITLRKAASNDIFLSARYDTDLGYRSKDDAIDDLKGMLFAETGGGSESGITPSEVQTMIDESISGKADTATVNQIANEAAQAILALSGAVDTNEADIADLWDTIDEKEEVIASALTQLNQDVAEIDAKEEVIASALTAVNDALTAHTANTTVHVTSAEKTAWNGKADTSAVTAVANDVSTLSGAVDDAKAYYIDFAALTTQGIHDADWDAMVAAINAHRPIYAGLGDLYYTSECLYQDGGNRIIMTASDHNSHYFYTFVKNGSEDYSFSYTTKPYVTDADKTAWNAKQDALSAGTGIEISGNVISATGGGGATYSAGTNISIDSANTINCTLNLNNGSGAGSIVGNSSTALGKKSFAFAGGEAGTGSSVDTCFAIGYACKAKKHRTFAFGSNVDIKEITSAAFGDNIKLNAPRSFSTGYNNTTNNWTNIALGEELTTNNRPEFATGTYNNSVTGSTASGQTLFSVGNGTSSARHNAFEIRQNGDIYVNDGTNDVRLQDTITATASNTTALGGLKFIQCTQAEYDALVSGGTVDSSTIYFITNVVS